MSALAVGRLERAGEALFEGLADRRIPANFNYSWWPGGYYLPEMPGHSPAGVGNRALASAAKVCLRGYLESGSRGRSR
eukprot:10156427-Alexandrium_andersonii.AAC.1